MALLAVPSVDSALKVASTALTVVMVTDMDMLDMVLADMADTVLATARTLLLSTTLSVSTTSMADTVEREVTA